MGQSIQQKILIAQKLLQERQLSGWLFYDFQRSNEYAHKFLGLSKDLHFTRRFFYWIPVTGEPIKICHKIEHHLLEGIPGKEITYHSYSLLQERLADLLKGHNRIAMEYSPKGELPALSKVDGGTCEWVRSLGVEIVSSCDLLPHFTAQLDKEQIQSHRQAALLLHQIAEEVWEWISTELSLRKRVTEYDIQQRILQTYKSAGYEADSPPICAVNAHSANPHYSPGFDSLPLQKGDLILIDLWCKNRADRAVYADITRVAVALDKPTKEQEEVFQIVYDAQERAIDFVRSRFAEQRPVYGYEVDQVCRLFIERKGYGEYFTHRTGHNIEVDLHGSGPNFDNFETKDVRPLLPATCYSVEPGIYLPNRFGVRLECDLLITEQGEVEVTGGRQHKIRCLLT